MSAVPLPHSIPTQREPSGPPSLTRPGARGSVTCEACGTERVTVIAMTLTDGTPVDFVSCHRCEHRSWSHEGAPLAIDQVLSKATKVRA